ncbi:MAG: MiaB/RimO family radical SAM methylthiotransferase, partial [Sandaracinaceae bacterium]
PAEYTIRATDPRELSQGLHSAYVKIAEGCNRTCAFCTIPSFRGKQRSRPVADVVAEARRLVDAGTAELNLISQDTIAYGRDLSDGTDLATLVRAVADVEGLRWLRLFYLYPERLRGELVELLAGHDKVLPYVDMPLQHASDAMLKRMRRGHGGERLYELVEQLRERIGDRMVFRTAFIVGHPGETEADFEALLDFVTWARFDRIGVFRYSKEESTRSGEMEDEVPEELAEERRDRLLAAQAPISRAKVRAMLGTDVDVLVERVSEESELLLEGRWWGQAPEIDGKVYLANGEARPGEIRRAYVTQAAEHDLVADLYERDGTLPEPPPGSDPRPKRRHLPTL